MTTSKPSTRTSTCKPSTRKPSALITIAADEAVLLWDALTDRSTALQVRALLPDRIQIVAGPRLARSEPKPVAAVPAPHAVGRAAA
jgi:hypothetical protein